MKGFHEWKKSIKILDYSYDVKLGTYRVIIFIAHRTVCQEVVIPNQH